MASQNDSILIDRDRADEAKFADLRSNLTDLLWGMCPRVARIRLNCADRTVFNLSLVVPDVNFGRRFICHECSPSILRRAFCAYRLTEESREIDAKLSKTFVSGGKSR